MKNKTLRMWKINIVFAVCFSVVGGALVYMKWRGLVVNEDSWWNALLGSVLLFCGLPVVIWIYNKRQIKNNRDLSNNEQRNGEA